MNRVSKTKSFLLALIFIIGLIFFNLPNVSNKIKNYFYLVSSPIQKNVDKGIKQIKSSWDFLNSLKDISDENIYLREKVKELTAQNIKLQELEKENEFLRSYLDLPVSKKYKIDLANISGREFQGLEKYVLIDRGNSENIEKDMIVIASKNILVGRVVEVFDNFSKVLLVTSPSSKISALVQGSMIEGLIKGKEKNILSLNLVSKDLFVEKGQTVISSGLGAIFPKGLLIGNISKVELIENQMFQEIEVTSTIDIEKLERVFIVLNF